MAIALDEIVTNKRAEVASRKASVATGDLARSVQRADGSFLRALQTDGLSLITEIKPASPSGGVLRENLDLDAVLDSYNRHACAISVLTDQKYFNGSLELLSAVARKSPLPLLCKDFVVDALQVYEARQAGAQAVLLIVKILDDDLLAGLHATIAAVGMTPVVEIQNEEELDRALAVGPQVLLINNRDLSTFDINLETTLRLAPMIPHSVTAISASGIQSRADIEVLLPCCSRFLVGSALMRSPELEKKLKELRGL